MKPVSPARFAAPATPPVFSRSIGLRVTPVALISMLVLAGCTKEEAPPAVASKPVTAPATPGAPAAPGTPKAPTPVNEAELAKIPILPGYKYYVGGPKLKADKYGKQRIERFVDEVAQPPSRGMIFGAKQEGDKLEYTVWGNGRKLALHRGTMRDGLFWGDYVEAYKGGKLVARETITHDDQAQRSKIVTEEFDYETGEPIRTKESFKAYAPLPMPEEMEKDDGSAPAGKEPKAGTPAVPGAASKGDAPAAPAAEPATPPAH